MNDAQVAAINDSALEAYGRLYLKASTRNLGQVATRPHISELRGTLRGVPAILVSAGPSLDKNIDQLKRFEGRACIIAISQTLRALHAAGVTPTVAICADPLPLRHHFVARVPVLALSPSVHPSLFDVEAGSVMTTPTSPVSERWLYNAMGLSGECRPGNSVAHCALNLALELGCNPIVAVGQDFALGPDAQMYGSNTADGGLKFDAVAPDALLELDTANRRELRAQDPRMFRALAVPPRKQLVAVPGWAADTSAVTTTDMLPMLRMYSVIAQAEAARGTRLINATEGGAHIDGMEHLSLVELNTPELVDLIPRLHRVTPNRLGLLRPALRVMRKNLDRLGSLAASLLAKSERGAGATRLEFSRAAAECSFFQLWCVHQLKAIQRLNTNSHPLELADAERQLFASTVKLADEMGDALRVGSAWATKSEPSSPHVTVNTFTRSA